jgi:hypothetical protein
LNPLLRSENGWKVDKPSLLTWIITLIIGAIFAIPGTYYGMKHWIAELERRATASEVIIKGNCDKISELEKYAVQDKMQTEWFKEKFLFIGKALEEIKADQKRRVKVEWR